MKRLIWVNGRLSWPLVAAIAYLSASLIAVDAVWRSVVMPFDTLLIYAVIVDGAVAGLLIALYVVLRAKVGIRS